MAITEGQLIKRGKFYHWRHRVDGEPRSISLKVTQLGEAKRIRQAHIAAYNEDKEAFLQPDADPTLAKFWEGYEPWAANHKAESTVEMDRRAWERLAQFMKRGCTVGNITSNDIERFKARLKDHGIGGGPLSDASINHYLMHLKAVLNQGITLGLYTGKNPFIGVRMFKIPKTDPDFFTAEETEALLAAAKTHSRDLYWVFLLGVFVGLRKGEIVNTRWEWFDFDAKLVKVTRSATFEIKDREERTIPLAKRLAEALEPHRQAEGYLFDSGRPSNGKWRYRYDPKKAFAVVAEAAGVPRATFQLLRHTFGSRLAQQGVSLFKVSRWMGHSSVNVTAKHYAGLQEYDEEIDLI